MALEARASKTVRLKNLLIVVLCVIFLGMFAYDGFYNYAARNDRVVAGLRDSGKLDILDTTFLKEWKGWNQESAENQERVERIIGTQKQIQIEGVDLEKFKSALDVSVQRWICAGLLVLAAASIWWLFHCQRRRAIADEQTVSPEPGLVIPWEKITLVDNTRWKSTGIVTITYLDEQGKADKAEFDDYKLEREPLLEILDKLGEKAVNAEFIPKEQAAESSGPETKGDVGGAEGGK